MQKKALVTGGSRGIGAAVSRDLAASGVLVTVASRSSDSLSNLVSSLPGSGHKKYEIDFQDSDELALFLESIAIEEYDIVVNNLGGNLQFTDPLDTYDSFQKVMEYNLGNSVKINSKVIPGMIKKKWGRITHVSSISALENQGPPQYCAAKAALNAYVRSVGRFIAPQGIIVTGVMPGAVMTEGGYWEDVLKNRPQHGEEFLRHRMAIGRFGTPEEISAVIMFLVSEKASFMPGAVVLADGGQGRVFQ